MRSTVYLTIFYVKNIVETLESAFLKPFLMPAEEDFVISYEITPRRTSTIGFNKSSNKRTSSVVFHYTAHFFPFIILSRILIWRSEKRLLINQKHPHLLLITTLCTHLLLILLLLEFLPNHIQFLCREQINS